MLIKESCNLIERQAHQALRGCFPLMTISIQKKQRYKLRYLSPDNDDQRILQFDEIRGAKGPTQPKVVVSDSIMQNISDIDLFLLEILMINGYRNQIG